MKLKPIAIIVPWYGDDIRGGAEKESNYLAHSISLLDQPVEIFTTCVKDAASDRGKNTIPSGKFEEHRIIVRRFKVNENRNIESYNESNLKIYRNESFTEQDEQIYFNEDINSPDMYDFIANHINDYRAFLFIPYMYGITFNGPKYCKGKNILIPCLHDESYAHMKILYNHMNSFQGMVFLSKPEQKLATKLYGLKDIKQAVLGGVVDTDWVTTCDANNFRSKYCINKPFILFAGRKDAGKKADELIKFFIRFKREYPENQLQLVMIGGGKLLLEIPIDLKNDIIDLGFVSEEDKHNAYAACQFLCNPSYYESFSIVIMESWLAKRPVLVSEHCAVTSNFALETNGGLWYKNYFEFRECLKFLCNNKLASDIMGINGYNYVMNHFSSKAIAKNYIKFIEQCGL